MLPPRYTFFLLSPANLGGARARLVCNPAASFPLAEELRSPGGAPLGAVFSFVSGLYFRGKVTYAGAFGKAPPGVSAGLVISPAEGLHFLDERVTLERLRSWAEVPVDPGEPRFTRPLIEHAAALSRTFGAEARVVLLGSVATDKYVRPLLEVFGDALLFPRAFVGRGDMSRGAMMLQAARAGAELEYAPVLGAERRGRSAPPASRAAPAEPVDPAKRAPRR